MTNSWGYHRKQRARIHTPEVVDRWTGDGWSECRVLDRNGSLYYVEDTDGQGQPGWVGAEDLKGK